MNRPVPILPESDLDLILERNMSLLKSIEGSKILLTGITGFVGGWIFQTFLRASLRFDLNVELTALSRVASRHDLGKFPNVHFLEHNLLSPLPKNLTSFDFVFSSITPSQPRTGGLDSDYVKKITLVGNQNLINHLTKSALPVRYFNTSSGAVEKYTSAQLLSKNLLSDTYAQSKIELEKYLGKFQGVRGISVINGRLFTFLGPGIPLDAHFAVGNFLRDARNGIPVKILGNSRTVRTYLHPIDMVTQILDAWLSQDHTYTIPIASFDEVDMASLAHCISKLFGCGGVEYLGDHLDPSRYVPTELKFNNQPRQSINLQDGLTRWNEWLGDIR